MARGQNLPDFTICARPPTLVWGLAVILRSCLKRLIEITFGVCKHALVLQLQNCGEEFQASSVMATPGRCLVPPSPLGPPQH